MAVQQCWTVKKMSMKVTILSFAVLLMLNLTAS
jgi:hypothetical protein